LYRLVPRLEWIGVGVALFRMILNNGTNLLSRMILNKDSGRKFH